MNSDTHIISHDNHDGRIRSMIHRTPTGYIVDRDPDGHTYDMLTDAVTIAATILMEELVERCSRKREVTA